MDWSHIRAFLAVAETGSLTQAARRLGQSQPTLGRHIKAAEKAIGVELFTRAPGGLELTEAGRMLVAPAQDMAAASARLMTIAAGRDMQLSGTVRITASVIVSSFILPPILAELRAAEPQIEIELAPSDTTENLIFREADIAIRMYRPTQLDVVTRKVTESPLSLYANKDLLRRVGQPASLKDLEAMPFVGFDRSDLILRHMRGLGFDIDRHFFGMRCDDQVAFWQLIVAGCGVGAMQQVIGDREPLVERLAVQPPLPPLPVWLAAHEALHRTPRVKRVWDHLVQALGGPTGYG